MNIQQVRFDSEVEKVDIRKDVVVVGKWVGFICVANIECWTGHFIQPSFVICIQGEAAHKSVPSANNVGVHSPTRERTAGVGS